MNFFRANETVYMVMRYERGRTLQQQIQMRQDQMSERLVRHVFMHLLNGLRASDTFNVMLFSGSSRMLAPASVPATRANIEQAIKAGEATHSGQIRFVVEGRNKRVPVATMPGVERLTVDEAVRDAARAAGGRWSARPLPDAGCSRAGLRRVVRLLAPLASERLRGRPV